MSTRQISRRLSRMIDKISISPRLIIILTAYGITLMLLSLALLYYPLHVIALSLLAGMMVDKWAWIKSRRRAWKENRQGSFGN